MPGADFFWLCDWVPQSQPRMPTIPSPAPCQCDSTEGVDPKGLARPHVSLSSALGAGLSAALGLRPNRKGPPFLPHSSSVILALVAGIHCDACSVARKLPIGLKPGPWLKAGMTISVRPYVFWLCARHRLAQLCVPLDFR
jgi:hypothetical protein